MFSKKLVATIAVAAAAVLAPATAAHAAPSPAPAEADGIIAILIGAVAPPKEHRAHGCPNCPHPAVFSDGVGVSYAQIEPTGMEYPNLV